MKIITGQDLYRKWIPSDAGLYHQPAWMDLFNPDWSAQTILTTQDEPVWLWPYRKRFRYGLTKYGRLAFCPDNGPVRTGPGSELDFEPDFDRWFTMVVIDDRTGQLDTQRQVQKGWEQTDRFYQYIDILSYPRDFQGVTRSKRKRMKKASRLEFFQMENPNEADDLFLIYFHKNGFPHFNYNHLKRKKDQMDESFDNYLFGIKDADGQILAAQWLVGYRDTLYGWIAIRHPDHRDSHARELLLWHIIQWARDQYMVYDLGGSTIPGVRRFNLEMGGEERKYVRYERSWPQVFMICSRMLKF